jgi:hypothetical protein
LGLQTGSGIATIAKHMLTINDLLQALEPFHKKLAGLEQGQQGLKQVVERVETGQGQLREDIKNVDLKVDVVLDYQKKAHTEIMERLFESNEANGQEQQRLEKRIERIEKHLGLPPLK